MDVDQDRPMVVPGSPPATLLPNSPSRLPGDDGTTLTSTGSIGRDASRSPSPGPGATAMRSVSVSPSDAGDREERQAGLGREQYWERITELAKMTALADELERHDVTRQSSLNRSMDPPLQHSDGHSATSPRRASPLSFWSLPRASLQASSTTSSRRSLPARDLIASSPNPSHHESSPQPTSQSLRRTTPRPRSPIPLGVSSSRQRDHDDAADSAHSSQISVESRSLSQILASPGPTPALIGHSESSTASTAREGPRHPSPTCRSPAQRTQANDESTGSSPPRQSAVPALSSSSPSPSPEPAPAPAGRGLRQRTLAQLNPYSIEQARYTRTLLKNGWQGAVVAGPKKGDEMTPEEMKRRKEELRKKGKDNLGGWLEFEEGERIRTGHQDENDESRSEGSVDGEDLLMREERRRKRMEKQVRRAMGGYTRTDADRARPSGPHEDHARGPAGKKRHRPNGGTTAKRKPRKQLENADKPQRPSNTAAFESEEGSDASSSQSSSAEILGSTKKRKKAMPSKSIHARSGQRGTKRSALDAQLLEIEVSSSSSSSEQEEEGEEGPDASMDSTSSSSPRRPPLVSAVDKTKLKGKRKKALGMMMPAVFMKKAQADLVAMEREKRDGLTSGSDFGSGDDEVLSSSSDREPAKGVAKARRVPGLDSGPLVFKGDAFTDESGEDEDVLGRVSDDDEEGDAVESWLHAFAPKRRVADDEDIVDRFLKRAKKNTIGSRKKAVTKAVKGASRSATSKRQPLHEKGNNERRQDLSKTSTSKPGSRAGKGISRVDKKRSRPPVKVISLDTGDAIFSYARDPGDGFGACSDDDTDSEQVPSYVARRQVDTSALITRASRSPPPISTTSVTASHRTTVAIEQWATFGKFSADFEIERLPAGLQCSESSFVRRGHLDSLLRRKAGANVGYRTHNAFGVLLDSTMSCEEVEAVVPQFCDAVFDAVCQGEDDEMLACGDALNLLGCLISEKFVGSTLASFSTSLSSQLERLDHRLESVSHVAADTKLFATRRCLLGWYCFDLAIRLELPTEKVHALATSLIDRLIKRGVEHSMKWLKAAAGSPSTTSIDDVSIHVWSGLVSVAVDSDEHEGGPWYEADLWRIAFERVMATLSPRAQRGPVAGEIVSYTAMVLCAISQFSPSGISTSAPRLHAHWGATMRALEPIDVVGLAKSDHTLSNTAIARRDRYIWTLFARCLVFINRWEWKIDPRGDIVSKLFDLISARRLADLSIEMQGDFASFLQDPDEFGSTRSLELDRKNDTAFVAFLKIVISAAQGIVAMHEVRQLTRLFFRLTPITSQAWTRASPELARSHSVLINHYSLLITFARLAPSSAVQRLDQARRLIDFARVDEDARRTSIRAVLYFTFVFRAHDLDLAPIVDWLGSIATQLRKEYVELEQKRRIDARGAGKKDANLPRPTGADPLWHRAVLLTMVLRSIQLVLKSDRQAEPTFPELSMLNSAWTASLLESPLALDPMIGLEIVRTVTCFLDLRHAALPRSKGIQAPTATDNGISQDEFGVFDEMDFEDPALNAMLGVEATTTSATSAAAVPDERDIFRSKDRLFAQMIKSELSPAFFRLVSNIFGVSEWRGPTVGDRVAYAQQVVECWARCILVMVQNDLVDWSGYLRYGDQSWKRIIDPIGRREIGLLLAIQIVRNDHEAVTVFQDDLLDIWYQSIVAYSLSSQHVLTSCLLNAEPVSPLFESAQNLLERNYDFKFELDEHTIDEQRLGILSSTFRCAAQHLSATVSDPLHQFKRSSSTNRTTILYLFRAMLASMKDNLAAITNERSRTSYASFVRKVLEALRECGAPDVTEHTLVDWRGLEKAIGA